MRAFPADRRGLSLLEMLIAAGLVLMLTALLAEVLVPSLGILSRSSQRSGLQQEARQALDRLERDLRRSTVFETTLGPTALAIHRLADGTFSGAPRWENDLIIYSYQKPVLIRRTVPKPASRLTPTELGTLASTPNGTEAALAKNASAFSVTKDELGAFTLTLQLKEHDEVLNLSRTVFLRNH